MDIITALITRPPSVDRVVSLGYMPLCTNIITVCSLNGRKFPLSGAARPKVFSHVGARDGVEGWQFWPVLCCLLGSMHHGSEYANRAQSAWLGRHEVARVVCVQAAD